jgi:hypothetical protein
MEGKELAPWKWTSPCHRAGQGYESALFGASRVGQETSYKYCAVNCSRNIKKKEENTERKELRSGWSAGLPLLYDLHEATQLRRSSLKRSAKVGGQLGTCQLAFA